MTPTFLVLPLVQTFTVQNGFMNRSAVGMTLLVPLAVSLPELEQKRPGEWSTMPRWAVAGLVDDWTVFPLITAQVGLLVATSASQSTKAARLTVVQGNESASSVL